MKKKLFSIVLSLILAVTMLMPTTAFAADNEATGASPYEGKGQVSKDVKSIKVKNLKESVKAKLNIDEESDVEVDVETEVDVDTDEDAEAPEGEGLEPKTSIGGAKKVSSYYMPGVYGIYAYSFTSSKVELEWNNVDDECLECYAILISRYSDFRTYDIKIVEPEWYEEYGYDVVSGLTKGKKYYFTVLACGTDYDGEFVCSDIVDYHWATPSPNQVTVKLSSSTKFKARYIKLYYTDSYLICKVKYQNKTKKKVKYIKSTRIKIKDSWGYTYMNKSFGKKKINLKKGKSKWVTYKIPRKKLPYYANLRYDLNTFQVTYTYK